MIKGTFETAEERSAAHNRYIADDMQNTASTARNLMGISTTERIRNLEGIIQEYQEMCGPLPGGAVGAEAQSGFNPGFQAQSGFNPGFQAQSGFNPGFQAQFGAHQGFGPEVWNLKLEEALIKKKKIEEKNREL